MGETKIEWTDAVWNPVRGCARVSPGCEQCYAERFAGRFAGEGLPYEGLVRLGKNGARWTGEARFVPEMLAQPLSWRKPRRVFVNSMSDLFHDDVTDERPRWHRRRWSRRAHRAVAKETSVNRLCFTKSDWHRCRFSSCRAKSREVYMVNGVHVRLCGDHRDCRYEDLKPVDKRRRSACPSPPAPEFGLCAACLDLVGGEMGEEAT